MPMVNQPEDFASILRDFERRIRLLESGTPAASTSIADTLGNELVRLDRQGVKVYDDAGVLRARLGFIDNDVGYGVSVFDPAGGLRFEVNDDGYRDPWLVHPWRPSTPLYVPVTSASFVDVFESRIDLITHLGVGAWVQWATDGATTGEIRLLLGGSTTSAVSLAAGSNDVQQFKWLHGAALGGGPSLFKIQARRTGGGGNVNVYFASGCQMIDPLQCDADGVP